MKDIILFWMTYKLFPYERMLGKREILSLLEPKEIVEQEGHLIARECKHPEQAVNLVYFSAYELDGTLFYTTQKKREDSSEKKQNTRYFAHGIHEYKGKFNPQIVRSIMNICHAGDGRIILDPFCGSGTSLLEAQLQGAEAYGIDANPMAVFIAKVKTNILFNRDEIIKFDIDSFISDVIHFTNSMSNKDNSRSEYLRSWFNEDIFLFIEAWKLLSGTIENEVLRDLLLLSLSNKLRDYSLQEPSDLRIRRRKAPFPPEPISVAARNGFIKCQTKIRQFSCAKFSPHVHVINGKIQSISTKDLPMFDLAVTSPPYATALPYIDTQRLSIVWLGLDIPKNIKALECSLTGTRETPSKQDREKRYNAMSNNANNLCEPIINLCLDLQNKLIHTDGFRKQHTPFLLYNYFSEMAQMFENVHKMLKTGAHYCLVVGLNRTKIGGDTVIDTPSLLAQEAKSRGFQIEDILPLNTYQRYGLHAKQSITDESLIILKA